MTHRAQRVQPCPFGVGHAERPCPAPPTTPPLGGVGGGDTVALSGPSVASVASVSLGHGHAGMNLAPIPSRSVPSRRPARIACRRASASARRHLGGRSSLPVDASARRPGPATREMYVNVNDARKVPPRNSCKGAT